MLNRRQTKILKKVFLKSKPEDYLIGSSCYRGKDFLIRKYFLFYTLRTKEKNYFVSLISFRYLGILVISILTAFFISFSHVYDGMGGSEYFHYLIWGFYNWSWIPVIVMFGYNLINFKLLNIILKIQNIDNKKRKETAEKEADEFVENLLKKNKKLERKIKLEEIEK